MLRGLRRLTDRLLFKQMYIVTNLMKRAEVDLLAEVQQQRRRINVTAAKMAMTPAPPIPTYIALCPDFSV
jgi:hypothetical protein